VRSIHYLLVPLFYLCIAMAGKVFTAPGVMSWYPALVKPSFTPPGSLIGITLRIIYILTALSLIIYINAARGRHLFGTLITLYITNGVLNALWSYFFFIKHDFIFAILDAGLIGFTVALMIVLVKRSSLLSSLLLLPYLVWVCFATFLTYSIYRLN
jgi:tryptophan-rich sensory protein